jgi:hypothetical protein
MKILLIFSLYAGSHLYARRQEIYALIGQLKQDLEFTIKLRGGQSKNFGWFFGQFFITNAKVTVLGTYETISSWIIDSRSNSNEASKT